MWWRIVGVFLLVGLVMTAIKIIIALLILAGLIFRTKETVGVLLVLGTLTLIGRYPLWSLGGLAVVGLVLFYLYRRKQRQDALPAISKEIQP